VRYRTVSLWSAHVRCHRNDNGIVSLVSCGIPMGTTCALPRTALRHSSSTSVGVCTGSLASLVALVQSTMAVMRLDMEVALLSTMHASS
jgi:hypothetical protein